MLLAISCCYFEERAWQLDLEHESCASAFSGLVDQDMRGACSPEHQHLGTALQAWMLVTESSQLGSQ